MKSYEETVRSVLDRVHAGDAPKKPKRSKVIPAVIACCILTVGLAVRLLPVSLSSNQPGPNDVIVNINTETIMVINTFFSFLFDTIIITTFLCY